MQYDLSTGIRLYSMGRYENALEEFFGIDSEPGSNPVLSYYIGLCYTKLEKYEDALLYLEQVVTVSENLLHIYQCRMVLGFIYALTGRFRLAQFEFDELIKGGYESPQTYAALGYIAYMQKQKIKGIEFFEKALSLDPDNANAMNSLGYTLAEEGMRLEKAEQLCKKAIKKQPENPAYLDSLGWVYYQQGKPEVAIDYLRKALDKAGGNKTIAEHIRVVLGEKKE
jgi:tetratricopeptide (TPR) repeat protein